MKRTFLLAIFLATAIQISPVGACWSSAYDAERCGQITKYTTFLLNDRGKAAFASNNVPWAVQIRMDNNFTCLGTLITSKHVISTSKCMNAYKPENGQRKGGNHLIKKLEVRVGSLCTKVDKDAKCINDFELGTSFRVSAVAFHPKADLSIVFLRGSAANVDGANHICLPFGQFERNYNSSDMGVFGWGSNEIKGETRPMLQNGTMKHMEKEDCQEVLNTTLSHDLYCLEETEESSLCEKDIGGGITMKNEVDNKFYLEGVSSSGTDCIDISNGTSDPRAVLVTDIRPHLNFVLAFTKDQSSKMIENLIKQ